MNEVAAVAGVGILVVDSGDDAAAGGELWDDFDCDDARRTCVTCASGEASSPLRNRACSFGPCWSSTAMSGLERKSMTRVTRPWISTRRS